jgi:hypothetical protein
MSGKIYTRTMDDAVKVSDPMDKRVKETEFCLTAHVHFMATDMNEAMAKLAEYFANSAGTPDCHGSKDKTFHAGTMTVGRASSLHATLLEPDPEVTH